jgi:S1-C subfamily serine protease
VIGTAAGSPAAAAGLGYGDVVTSIAGHPVTDHEDSRLILAGFAPGEKVLVTWVAGDHQKHSATVTLASGPPL